MSYTVLARKYRPQRFADLVGQEHVARTLGNAIEQDRVAHAFLFTGVRGVGKTTTARLLAKALNCEKGPASEPCNTCSICEQISQGNDIDVQEMDGASNNSVDDVRRLQETLPFRPARDRFKVVIVDEVHMLSTGAFNAFLKTLEEPPEHVKFIFATTELHKVPVTIRSRCQRYDFRLIPQRVIAARVREILAEEQLEADDEAVALVAREAAGSMRDALTLLDQVVAFSDGALRGQQIGEVLGVADRSRVQDLAAQVVAADARAILESLKALSDQGRDMFHLSRQLLGLFRDLVVLRVTDGQSGELLDLVDEELRAAQSLAESESALELQRLFAGMSKLVDEVAHAPQPRLSLEMGLVRLATRPKLEDLTQLLARLDGAASDTPKKKVPVEPKSRSAALDERFSPPPEPDIPHPAEQSQPVVGARADAPAAEAPAERKVVSAARPEPAAAPSPPPTPSGHFSWPALVDYVQESNPALAAVLAHGVLGSVTDDRIVIHFQEGAFYGKQAGTDDSLRAVSQAASAFLKRAVAAEVRMVERVEAEETVIGAQNQRRDEERESRRRAVLSHPRVMDALSVFPAAAGQVKVVLDEVEHDIKTQR